MSIRMILGGACVSLCLGSSALAEPDSSQFIGYFRTTLGTSQGGGMPDFRAPAARAHYRLGNEPDTVFEAGIDHRFAQGPNAPKGSYLQGVFMLNGYAAIGESNKLDASGLVQAYVKMARYFGDFDLWVGRRYYQRQAVDMIDYFWLNTAQGAHVGAGLEDLPVGKGKVDFAVMNYEDVDVASVKDPTVKETLHSRLFEVRYRDIALTDSLKLSSWLSYTDRPEDPGLGYKQEKGQAAALWLDITQGAFSDTVTGIYRSGLGITQGNTDARPIRETSGYVLSKAKVAEVSNTARWETSELSLQFLLLQHQENTGVNGTAGGDQISWTSYGVRPVYYLNEFHSLALEVGRDQVDNKQNGTDGALTKETLAWQLTKQKSAGARPLIRLFVTQAQWSNSFKGAIASATTFKDKTAGWSAGIQTEVWW